MPEGLSTNLHCHPFADCLVAEGKKFVIRYHSRTTTQPQKRISPVEAAALARAGLEIACVYQDNGRLPEDFGRDRGVLDGRSAQGYAAQIGQPPGSAIYFAVDHDFSAAEIQSFVLPYFEGVRAGLDEAAGGTSDFVIGVYGSGLACQLVRDNNALARFAWLAEATAWRGSADYDRWDVRQHVNAASLCGLERNWERCEASGPFGQFRPIGFEVTQGQGALMRVTAAELNLRLAPTTNSRPPLARLPEHQQVRVLGKAASPWLRVRASLGGSDVIGYASGKYLAPLLAGTTDAVTTSAPIPAVHFRENDADSRRSSTAKRAQPLGEPGQPMRTPTADATTRVAQLNGLVDWLDAEHSARYQRDVVTYCNVYSADYCYLASAYLPRTWWQEAALMQIAAGTVPSVVYGTTIREMRADDLHAWLLQFGSDFGWTRVFDCTALQDAANNGGIGVICADRDAAGKPGHITIVVPESATKAAQRDADLNVVLPLQSQAGAENFNRSTLGRAWWMDPMFRSFVFFVHA
jgi:hypothetical protein